MYRQQTNASIPPLTLMSDNAAMCGTATLMSDHSTWQYVAWHAYNYEGPQTKTSTDKLHRQFVFILELHSLYNR